MVSMKARRQSLFIGRIRQQVTRKLFYRELVKRHVFVESFNDPVSPRPVLPSSVRLKSVRVAVACTVQPPHRHTFAVMRGRQ